MVSAMAPLTFLLFIESRTREWYQLRSRWDFSPQLNIIESGLKDPPEVCLSCHHKASQVDNDDGPSHTCNSFCPELFSVLCC